MAVSTGASEFPDGPLRLRCLMRLRSKVTTRFWLQEASSVASSQQEMRRGLVLYVSTRTEVLTPLTALVEGQPPGSEAWRLQEPLRQRSNPTETWWLRGKQVLRMALSLGCLSRCPVTTGDSSTQPSEPQARSRRALAAMALRLLPAWCFTPTARSWLPEMPTVILQ